MTGREPPSPPRIPPKVRLHRSELFGLPFLVALPLLAVLGVFGPTIETAHGQSGAVSWSVEYPSRIRYEKAERLLVHVANLSAAPVSGVVLGFDPDYIHAFTNVAFDPAPKAPYVVSIPELAPGESRLVAVQLTADAYGSHRGWLTLSAGASQTKTELSTFVFP